MQETEKEKHLLFSLIYSKIHSLWPKVLFLTKNVVYIYHHNHTKILMSKLQKKKKGGNGNTQNQENMYLKV